MLESHKTRPFTSRVTVDPGQSQSESKTDPKQLSKEHFVRLHANLSEHNMAFDPGSIRRIAPGRAIGPYNSFLEPKSEFIKGH